MVVMRLPGKPRSRFFTAFYMAVLLCSTALSLAPANAQTTTWVEGSGMGNTWAGSSNWDNGAPDMTTDAVVPSPTGGGPGFVVHNALNGEARSVVLGTVLNVRQQGELTVGQGFIASGPGAQLRLEDINSIVTTGGLFSFEQGGVVRVEDNATLLTNGGAALSGLAGSADRFEGDVNGGTWNNVGELMLGTVGEAYLQVRAGGVVNTDDLTVGDAPGAYGELRLGAGTLTTSGISQIGNAGTAQIHLISNSVLNTQVTRVGDDVGGHGTVRVDGGAWNNGGILTIANLGQGEAFLQNAAALDTYGLVIGSADDVTGILSLENSSLSVTQSAYVGEYGGGQLLLLDGSTATIGTASNNDLLIGYESTAVGLVQVSGGSTLTGTGSLFVGTHGAGRLGVDGSGSTVTFDAMTAAVTDGSRGEIALSNGGLLRSATFQAATDLDSVAMFTLSGANTEWENSADAHIGVSGDAVLGVFDSALVSINGNLAIGNTGVTGQSTLALRGGAIAVGGDLSQYENSSYGYVIGDGASAGGSLDVVGAATIANGARLVVGLDGNLSDGDQFVVLTATGGVAGTYALVNGGQVSAFLSVDAIYDPTQVSLQVNAQDFASVARTPNQLATASGVQSLGAGNSLFQDVLTIATEDAARYALDRLSGELHASIKTGLMEESRFIRDAVGDRLRIGFGEAAATVTPILAYAPGGPELISTSTETAALWAEGFGAWGQWNSDGNAARFRQDDAGLMIGADGNLGDWRVGLLAGNSRSGFVVDDRASSGTANSYHVSLYGGTQWGNVAFRSGLAHSWHNIETERSVVFPGVSEVLSAAYGAATTQAFGEVGYRFEPTPDAALEPFANLAFVRHGTNAFTESGGSTQLSAAAQAVNSTFATLGVRASQNFSIGTINITAKGMLAWRHTFGGTTPTTDLAFVGGNSFSIAGVPVGRDAALIEAGLDFAFNPMATVSADYSGQFAGAGNDHAIKGSLNVRF